MSSDYLKELNDQIEDLVKKRSSYLDDLMPKMAKWPMDTELFEEDGSLVGRVSSYYRFWAGDARYDTSSHTECEIEISPGTFTNTSGSYRYKWIGSKEELKLRLTAKIKQMETK